MKGKKRWIKWHLLLMLAPLAAHTIAQVFPVDYPPTREKFPFFHPDYIKNHRIKSLHTQVMYKSPMKVIVKSAESDSFLFNTDGVALKRWQTNPDSSLTIFTYHTNKNGLLASMRELNLVRDVTFTYTYNDHNDMVEVAQTDTKSGVILHTEKFKFVYEYYDQYKKYWLNDEGLTYKYSIIKLDDKKRIIEEKGRYIRGTSKHAIYYTYQGDKLTYYSSNIRETSRREKKYEMIYSTDGALVEMNEYKDGAYIHHHEFLYEGGLLVAILEKEIRSQRIKIIKFFYEVY